MKYCSELTKNHNIVKEYPLILREIKQILIDEGFVMSNTSPFFSNTDTVIDGDKLEELVAISEGRNKNKSMDLVFGIKNNSNHKYQLVELKLRSTTFYHLDKSSFLGKVLGTKNALGGNEINSDYYIVFQDTVIQQARRYLFRANPRLNNQFKAVNVGGLYAKFF